MLIFLFLEIWFVFVQLLLVVVVVAIVEVGARLCWASDFDFFAWVVASGRVHLFFVAGTRGVAAVHVAKCLSSAFPQLAVGMK